MPAGGEDVARKRHGYGCVEWQPQIEDTAVLQSKKQELKGSYQSQQLSDPCIQKLMCETYSIQRAEINSGAAVELLMEEWPYLFQTTPLFEHTSTLLGFKVQTKLMEEFSKKAKTIKDFLIVKGIKVEEIDPLQIMTGVANLFKEDPHHLFYNYDGSLAAQSLLPSMPCILIIGDDHFKIAVDQVIVNNHISSIVLALSYTFSLFYVLNIRYPKEMALTLEFIQRVFLGINPEKGTKAEKKGEKSYHLPPRLIRILNELNDFENPWKQ